MTTRPPTHVVVDGSNIATEGRSMPSLTQLNDAVLAYRAEHPNITITVVVDATFGHRIAKSEVAEFDAAIANNELVAPPAGAVGRGDAFVLGIANKANATVLSNDSFQEFHGQYDWLFDEGRLVGGKPVPHVGWVFVERTPVRGPVSRKAVRDSKRAPAPAEGRRRGRGRATTTVETVVLDAAPKKASREASLPMPVPTTPPPGRAVAADGVNELMPFLEFVERHPVGTSVNAVVDSYSSHGAYVRIGDVKGYVPLRSMGEPPPRSAREVMRIGDAVTLVVASFAPARRSIDLSMPQIPVQPTAGGEVVVETIVDAVAAPSARRGRGRRTADAFQDAAVVSAGSAAEPAPASRAGKKAAKKAAAEETTAEPAATAKRSTAKKSAATPAPAKKEAATAKKAAAKKAAATQAPAATAADTPAPAKKTSATATKATATKATARTATARRSTAEKSTAATAPATNAPAAAPAGPGRKASKASKASKAATAATAAAAPTTPAPVTDAVRPTGETQAVTRRRRRTARTDSS